MVGTLVFYTVAMSPNVEYLPGAGEISTLCKSWCTVFVHTRNHVGDLVPKVGQDILDWCPYVDCFDFLVSWRLDLGTRLHVTSRVHSWPSLLHGPPAYTVQQVGQWNRLDRGWKTAPKDGRFTKRWCVLCHPVPPACATSLVTWLPGHGSVTRDDDGRDV